MRAFLDDVMSQSKLTTQYKYRTLWSGIQLPFKYKHALFVQWVSQVKILNIYGDSYECLEESKDDEGRFAIVVLESDTVKLVVANLDKYENPVNVGCCGNIYYIFGHVQKLMFVIVNFSVIFIWSPETVKWITLAELALGRQKNIRHALAE